MEVHRWRKLVVRGLRECLGERERTS